MLTDNISADLAEVICVHEAPHTPVQRASLALTKLASGATPGPLARLSGDWTCASSLTQLRGGSSSSQPVPGLPRLRCWSHASGWAEEPAWRRKKKSFVSPNPINTVINILFQNLSLVDNFGTTPICSSLRKSKYFKSPFAYLNFEQFQ